METLVASLAVTMRESATTEVAMQSTLRLSCNASFLRRRRVAAAAPTRGPLMVPLLSRAATLESWRVSSGILCSLTMELACALFSPVLLCFLLSLSSLFLFKGESGVFFFFQKKKNFYWHCLMNVCVLVGLWEWMSFCL